MDRSTGDQLINVPDDWWRHRRVCEKVTHLLGKHVLGLLLCVKINGQSQEYVYTGFLLYHLHLLWWASAGHVVEKIHRVLTRPHTEVTAMRWLDDYGVQGAKSIPVNYDGLRLFSLTRFEIDFGVIQVGLLERQNMIANRGIAIIGEEVWQREGLPHPDGYYLLGFPAEWTSRQENSLAGGRVQHSVRAVLACLPVERVKYRSSHSRSNFWQDPEAFYGRIAPFADGLNSQPESIKGMSGGLVLSIERDRLEDDVRFGLVGVQRSWLGADRLIRAEPMRRIMSRIDEATELEQ